MLVTSKVTVQLELFGIVMPLKLKAVAPGEREFGIVPTQVPPTAPPTALIFIKLSVNEALVKSPVVFGFDKVRVTVEVPPVRIIEGLKDLAIVGGATTVRFAVAAVPELLFEVVTVLVVFIFNPALVPVTVTLKTQFAPAASEGLLNEITFPVIEYEPSVQTVVAPVFGAVTPEGRESVKESVFNARVVLGFESVNCRTEVELS